MNSSDFCNVIKNHHRKCTIFEQRSNCKDITKWWRSCRAPKISNSTPQLTYNWCIWAASTKVTNLSVDTTALHCSTISEIITNHLRHDRAHIGIIAVHSDPCLTAATRLSVAASGWDTIIPVSVLNIWTIWDWLSLRPLIQWATLFTAWRTISLSNTAKWQ